MTISLYDLSVLTFLQTMRAVSGFLDRAAKHCAETGDHLDVAVVCGGDGVHHPIPYTRLPPPHEAVAAGSARAKPLWQITPRRIAAP